jgi:uncharacterized membrane protein YfcA
MSIQTILILAVVGILSGVLSGFVGVGGGIIIVPGLVFALGMNQHLAQGTSLFILLLPIGFLAVFNYWKAGQIDWGAGLVIALAFVAGGYFGSKMALKLSPALVKLIFGIIMVVISSKLMYSGFIAYTNEK